MIGSGGATARMPGTVLLVAILYIIVLILFAVQYPHVSIKFFGLHSATHVAHLAYHVPRTIGPVPATVPWFGAVGGLLISLQGIFIYNRRWQHSYDYWHYLRPIVGALVGTMAVFILIVILNSAGASSSTTSLSKASATSESRRVLFEVVAFLVGYREETFRALMKRVLDVIISPGDAGGGSGPTPNPTSLSHTQ